MTFDLNKYEKGAGPTFACQLSIKLFIEDTINDFTQRKYAETVYEWLGLFDGSIDELCEVSFDKSVFILKVLEKYKINTSNSNLLLNYGDAIGSLKYQIDLINGQLKTNNNELPPSDAEEEEEKIYNGGYYADSMEMEAKMKEDIKWSKPKEESTNTVNSI